MRRKGVCSLTNCWVLLRSKLSGPMSSAFAHLQLKCCPQLCVVPDGKTLIAVVVSSLKIWVVLDSPFSFLFPSSQQSDLETLRRDCLQQDNSFVKMVHSTHGNIEPVSLPARVWGYFSYLWISPCKTELGTSGGKRWVCPFASSLAGIFSLWHLLPSLVLLTGGNF